MKKWVKIVLLSVAILVLAAMTIGIILCWYAPLYGRDDTVYDVTDKSDTGDDVTVMSFNIRCFSPEDLFRKSWFYRAPLVIQTIRDEQPDVIGFQEVSPLHEAYLRKHLVGYDFLVAYRTAKGSQEGVMLAVRTARFETLNSGYFWLSETPEVESKDWGSAFPRVAAYMRLYDKRTAKEATFVNTHLDHVGDLARGEGMRVIVEQKERLHWGETVLVGDMNDSVESSQYRFALANGFADAALHADHRYEGVGATYQDYGKQLDRARIDYIYYTASWHAKDYHVVDKTFQNVYASDHFAIVASLERED